MSRAVSQSVRQHPYEDHWQSGYSATQLSSLGRVLTFNKQLIEAFEAGRDVRAVTRLLDPDPIRYMSVSEGEGDLERDLDRASSMLSNAPVIAGHRRLSARSLEPTENGSSPAVAIGPDGTILLTWIEWVDGRGEQVLVIQLQPDGTSSKPPTSVSGDAADCFRPTAAFDTAGTPWVFYGVSRGNRAVVEARYLRSGQWSQPTAVSTGSPAFNQEVAPLSGGGLVCCWQQWMGGRFVIMARTCLAGDWTDPVIISSERDDNAWDPAIAVSSNGEVIYAWSSYREGSYKIITRRHSRGRLGPERQLSTGTDYGMHPSLACTSDGQVWCAFDRMTVQAHAGSGTTRLRPIAEVSQSRPLDGTLPLGHHFPSEGMMDLKAWIELVRIDDDALVSVPGVGHGLDVIPAGLPRLAATEDGCLLIAYRTIRRLPIITYYWEVALQILGREGLSDPMTFSGSDGGAEEPNIAAGSNSAVVVWQHDGRRDMALTWTEGFGGRECLHLRHHYGDVVWHSVHDNGRISWAQVASAGPASPLNGSALPIISSSGRREARPWLTSRLERYQTSADGTTYTLYWGDLHRHSLISRCVVADEPSLDDYYRYSRDICGYDFWALTDHAEHTSKQQWWSIQKAADLFRVNGKFAPLYGFEWTSRTGHQNVIFGPCSRGAPIASALAERSDNPDKLWALLRAHPDYPAITIPHHPGSAMTPFDWNYHDPEYVRLVEIFQACRGNYEADGCFRQFADATSPGSFVVDGLKRNYRFGLIASTDHGWGASYVGAYATGLDRESVFEALRARRTLAATTRGIAVDFRIGRVFMGGEVHASEPSELDAYVKAYREISHVDIVRNGDIAHQVSRPVDWPDGWLVLNLRIEWGFSAVTTDWSGTVQLNQGEFAQAEYWAPEVTAVRKNRIDWHSVLQHLGGATDGEPDLILGAGGYGPRRGGIEVTIAGPPEAMVTVTTKPASLQARLRQIASEKVIEVQARDGGRLRLQPGTGALLGLGTSETRIKWVDDWAASGWYYVRAILIDGEMAWSSPIWVDRE